MNRLALTLFMTAGVLIIPVWVCNASVKFKPFQCAAAINTCVKKSKVSARGDQAGTKSVPKVSLM